MRRKVFSGVMLTLASALVLLAPSAASAASSIGGNGLKVSPIRTSLTIKPGTSDSVPVYVTNVTKTATRLKVIINDFTARSDESGSPSIILNPNQQASAHSLKQFAVTPPDFDLAAHQQKKIDIKISIPDGAAGGGYYGAVRFVAAGSPSSGKNVNVATSVGSLILIKVPGDINEDLQLLSFNVVNNGSAGALFNSGKGLSVESRFQNNGNIQEIPQGKILLKKGDKTLATYELNNKDEPGNVLPGTIRKFDKPIKNLGWGKYQIEGNFGYGNNGQLLSAQKTFYIVPVWLIVAVIIIIILIILAIVFGRKELRRHDRRLLANYRRNNRSKRR